MIEIGGQNVMNKGKRVLALGLATALLTGLTACGNPSSTGDSTGQSAQGQPDNSAQQVQPQDSNSTQEFLDSITPETAEAKGVCGADLTWYYQDNVLVIKGTREMADYDSSDDLARQTIAPWRSYNDGEIEDSISWVVMDEGITYIGDYAFYNCDNLTKVIIPSTVTDIGNAFKALDNLQTLVFEGDAPELHWGIYGDNLTIYYSGSGYEELIESYSGYNWVKQ